MNLTEFRKAFFAPLPSHVAKKFSIDLTDSNELALSFRIPSEKLDQRGHSFQNNINDQIPHQIITFKFDTKSFNMNHFGCWTDFTNAPIDTVEFNPKMMSEIALAISTFVNLVNQQITK